MYLVYSHITTTQNNKDVNDNKANGIPITTY